MFFGVGWGGGLIGNSYIVSYSRVENFLGIPHTRETLSPHKSASDLNLANYPQDEKECHYHIKKKSFHWISFSHNGSEIHGGEEGKAWVLYTDRHHIHVVLCK